MLLLHYALFNKTLTVLTIVFQDKLSIQRPSNSYALIIIK